MRIGKSVIFSAPSGSGKSSIIQYLLQQGLPLQFSVSATNRLPRKNERHGVDYYFFTSDEFRARLQAGDFFEYEEVYDNRFYGTLNSEIERIARAGAVVIFDVDVVGGCRIKQLYGQMALSIFVMPPSLEELRRRLEQRGTDAPDVIDDRLAKAEYELGYASRYDRIIINDKLADAQRETFDAVSQFLRS